MYVPAESSGTQPPAFDVGFAHEGRRTAATSKRQGGHQVQRIWSFKNQKRSPTTFFTIQFNKMMPQMFGSCLYNEKDAPEKC
jgi:hypothetical protein